MTAYIMPGVILVLLVYAGFKKVNTYSSFVNGAKTSFDLVLSIFPYILAIFIAIELFVISGLSAMLANFVAPVFNILDIPTELAEMVLIKPFSGSGGIVLLDNIYTLHGADSYLARVASVVAGSSEAVFFVSAVLFSKTKIKNFSYAIPVILAVNFITVILAVQLCKII